MITILPENGKDIKEKMACLHHIFSNETRDENPTLDELVISWPERSRLPTAIIKRIINDKNEYIGGANGRGYIDMQKEITSRIGIKTFNSLIQQYNQNISGKDIFRLDNIFIQEKYRNHGLGTYIYNEIEQEGKEKGYKHIIIDTKANKHRLIKRYQKLGFKKIHACMLHGERFVLLIKQI